MKEAERTEERRARSGAVSVAVRGNGENKVIVVMKGSVVKYERSDA